MTIAPGAGGGIAVNILGICTSGGCPNARVDNISFNNWSGHPNVGNGYGIMSTGDVFGVIDHNVVNGKAGSGQYLQLVEFHHAKYLGVGYWGNNSWAQPESYGSQNFIFVENNLFNNAGACENEGLAGPYENEGGGRIVIRFNHFTNMDDVNAAFTWHGTESNGWPRGARTFEIYRNTIGCGLSDNCYVLGARSGTGLMWGNTVNQPNGTLTNFATFNTYRSWVPEAPWGTCDGSSPQDTNDGVVYWSGTIGSASGTGPTTITVSGANPGWTTNQWGPNTPGGMYSVHDVTQNQGSDIVANGANSLQVATFSGTVAGNSNPWVPAAGDSIQILRATACIDQGGGRGAGILFTTTNQVPLTIAAANTSSAEALSPSYFWSNTITATNPPNPYVTSSTARVHRNREFYNENMNQAAQTAPTSPFDGTTTIGLGHGAIANRPATCTTGVGYWATDQGNWNQGTSGGQLYKCTTTNTWSLYYTPYTYPHPVTSPGTGTGSGLGTAPAAPTGLSTIVH